MDDSWPLASELQILENHYHSILNTESRFSRAVAILNEGREVGILRGDRLIVFFCVLCPHQKTFAPVSAALYSPGMLDTRMVSDQRRRSTVLDCEVSGGSLPGTGTGRSRGSVGLVKVSEHSDLQSEVVFVGFWIETVELLVTDGLTGSLKLYRWAALEKVSGELRRDEEAVLAAERSMGTSPQYASEELRNTRQIVLEAAKTDGAAPEWAAQELRRDREVILATMETRKEALSFSKVPLDRKIFQRTLEKPHVEKPHVEKPHVEKPHGEKPEDVPDKLEVVVAMKLRRSSYRQMILRWAVAKLAG
eukprot:scaffold7081_cov225-Pinguiococcus_pyrenoidosus.AAC.4